MVCQLALQFPKFQPCNLCVSSARLPMCFHSFSPCFIHPGGHLISIYKYLIANMYCSLLKNKRFTCIVYSLGIGSRILQQVGYVHWPYLVSFQIETICYMKTSCCHRESLVFVFFIFSLSLSLCLSSSCLIYINSNITFWFSN